MKLKFNETKFSIYTFPLYIFLCILFGGIFGALLDNLIQMIQKESKSQIESLGFLFFQLIIMSFLIYVFVNGYISEFIDIHNFSTGSFFFNLSFFTLQPSIASNLRSMLNIKEKT